MPMDGKYPTLERVIPDPNEATRTFELPVEALREILLSLKPFAKCAANRVVLSFSAGLVTATVKRDDLKAFACTPAVRGTFAYREATPKQDGEEFAIALNCLYLLDLLPVARRGLRVPELIRLRCKKASTPVLVDYPNMETLDWDRLTCVIMPMSLD
jgi:DNA polymerase III sliding clamp (beta) subunit (PCNA family)